MRLREADKNKITEVVRTDIIFNFAVQLEIMVSFKQVKLS
jgi:hypothetical protein